MNRNRIRTEAIRDQAWADVRDDLDDLYRIAELEIMPDDVMLIRRACALVVSEIVYRARISQEVG